MKFALVICTYRRPVSLLNLLQSVKRQTLYPDEILIVDGSDNEETKQLLMGNSFKNLDYFQVPAEHLGLTRQRNYGVQRVSDAMEVICFLDDDVVLEHNYFEEIKKTFELSEEIIGVGGIAINENKWSKKISGLKYNKYSYFEFEGYVYPEAQRNIVRNYLGLQSNVSPGKMPEFSHGKTCGFPINGEIYEVDLLVGMSMSFRKKIIDSIKFSTYFEGYGLYEDADFSIRALKYGKNVINTKVQLSHFHNPSGRPNHYRYGKMVVRNGWYVWRVKNPHPEFLHRIKWHKITLLLILIRFTNIFTTGSKKSAFTETLGRTVGWWSLFFNKPTAE